MLWPSGYSSGPSSLQGRRLRYPRGQRCRDHRCRGRRCLRAMARPRKTRQPAPAEFAAASSPPTPARRCGARKCGSRPLSCASIVAPTTDADGTIRVSGASRRPLQPRRLAQWISYRSHSASSVRSSRDARSISGSAQEADKIDFALPRGGVIAGRVTDELGEPLAGVRVQAMRYQYLPNGRRQLTPVNPGGIFGPVTNDLGEFRLYSLMPGTYVVSAIPADTGHDGRSCLCRPPLPRRTTATASPTTPARSTSTKPSRSLSASRKSRMRRSRSCRSA